MCAKFIFGGNHDRTLQMAFGDQTVCTDRGEDNSHLHRCPEIEQWAMDVYDWCARRYGRENIIGFQVHLDETSPHIHALNTQKGRTVTTDCIPFVYLPTINVLNEYLPICTVFETLKWNFKNT